MPTYANYDKLRAEIKSYADNYLTRFPRQYGFNIYYRGHANCVWDYVPSIARTVDSESDIVKTAISDGKWDISRSLFDNIAHLQHYGKPTRFLDYTTDIDVALYFACSEHKDEDAELQIVAYDLRDNRNIDTIAITELALLNQTISVYDFAESILNKYPTEALDVVHYKDEGNTDWNIREIGARVLSWIDHGFMVTYSDADKKSLEEWNPRVLHQKGAFFVFGNQTNPPHVGAATYNVKSTSILPKIADTPHLLKEAKTIVIPKKLKQEVISALEEKGITESYIYPNETQL